MKEPTKDMFAVQTKEAPGLFCENVEAYAKQMEVPTGEEPVVWSIAVNRALQDIDFVLLKSQFANGLESRVRLRKAQGYVVAVNR